MTSNAALGGRLERPRRALADLAAIHEIVIGQHACHHRFPDRHRVLVYLYWEPANAEDLIEYRDHRNEVDDFSALVDDCATRFVALSYPALWHSWATNLTWPGMPGHIARLQQRYCYVV